jgi:predicted nucleic acid-binding protein
VERPLVVLDTNVFVGAGFNPRSASRRLLDAARRGEARMAWNAATRREIEHVLRRIPPLRAYPVADLFRPAARFRGRTRPERFAGVPDPDDRKFAALAHAAGAVLVTSDEHLLGAPARLGLRVMTPGAFWREFEQQHQP